LGGPVCLAAISSIQAIPHNTADQTTKDRPRSDTCPTPAYRSSNQTTSRSPSETTDGGLCPYPSGGLTPHQEEGEQDDSGKYFLGCDRHMSLLHLLLLAETMRGTRLVQSGTHTSPSLGL
jgi:hypothetical protein